MLTSHPPAIPYCSSGFPSDINSSKKTSLIIPTPLPSPGWLRFPQCAFNAFLVITLCRQCLFFHFLPNKTRSSRAIHLWIPRPQCGIRPRVNGYKHSLVQSTELMGGQSILGLILAPSNTSCLTLSVSLNYSASLSSHTK